ncbi:hypothetical protein SE91_26555 [Bradyrhizobium sp. DOA1]|nr:hypothetical protein SE91_26555 [Bradyrhizobium sp. DOA1]
MCFVGDRFDSDAEMGGQTYRESGQANIIRWNAHRACLVCHLRNQPGRATDLQMECIPSTATGIRNEITQTVPLGTTESL